MSDFPFKRSWRPMPCGDSIFLAIRPQRSLWRDVPVERLAGYAELPTELADLGFGLAHCDSIALVRLE
jgi:hypothetical protein